MIVKLIISDKDYQEVATRVERLRHAAPGSQGALALKVLTRAIVQYERGRINTAATSRMRA